MNRLERVTRAAALAQEAIDVIGKEWLGADYSGLDIGAAHGALCAARRLLASAMARESRGGAKPEQD